MKISMRRPVFAASVIFFVIMAFFYYARGYDESYRALDGNDITVAGTVYQKDSSGFNPAFYLKNIELISESASSQKNLKKYNLILRVNESDCSVNDIYDLRIGDRVTVTGRFICFEHGTNPGEFDAADYYHSLKIPGRLKDYEVTDLNKGKGLARLGEVIFILRTYFSKRLDKVFVPETAGVLKAMLLGDKRETDPGIKDLFRHSGIIHIISISGLHITLIAVSVYRLFKRAGMKKAVSAILATVLLIFYGMLVGMPMSAKRAICMFVIRMAADMMKRTYDMLTALGITAVLMIIFNPAYMLNSGFFLSFGSVMGIGAVFPLIRDCLHFSFVGRYTKSRIKKILTAGMHSIINSSCEMIMAGVSIMIFTWPIQLWFYYEVPIFSVLSNLLVLPFLSLLLIFGLIAMMVPGLGFLGTVSEVVVYFYKRICLLYEALPFNTLNPGRPPIQAVVIYYVILTLLCIWIRIYMRAEDTKKRRSKNQSLRINEVKRDEIQKHSSITQSLQVNKVKKDETQKQSFIAQFLQVNKTKRDEANKILDFIFRF
ncbi:MAG: ComEC/Rec2 family competence protein, partial [Lachnospiraceae bacterium]|nr:ComEC/Rec2 family competence protein [Lachnospiraceae bacterium]